MKKIAPKMIVILFLLIAFNFTGCAGKEVKLVKIKVPKLRTCVVKPKKVSYTIKEGNICLKKNDYKTLKKQNYRLRVCNELLNRQIRDYNKRYAK